MAVKNVCDCPDPPGGRVECEPHQMAACAIVDGVAQRVCLDPPSGGGARELVNWALQEITGVSRSPTDRIEGAELQTLLGNRFVRSSGAVVTFSLPETVVNAVELLMETTSGQGDVMEWEMDL